DHLFLATARRECRHTTWRAYHLIRFVCRARLLLRVLRFPMKLRAKIATQTLAEPVCQPAGNARAHDSSQHSGVFSFLWDAVAAWSDHEGQRLSAALAFYVTLSLAPLLLLLVSVTALVFGKTGAQQRMVSEAQ